jgi:hypothetical protein
MHRQCSYARMCVLPGATTFVTANVRYVEKGVTSGLVAVIEKAATVRIAARAHSSQAMSRGANLLVVASIRLPLWVL